MVRRRNKHGFTLIEAIASMAILGFMGVVVTRMMVGGASGHASGVNRAEMASNLSSAMNRVASELRGIAARASSSPVVPNIVSTTSSSIQWNTNSSLSVSGGTLHFVDSGATARVLLRDVTSFTIETFDKSGVALASSLSGAGAESIQRIRITIVCTRDGQVERLRTMVLPRCLGPGADT